MSAMDKMLIQMVGKALPPEVAEHLTPEGMARLGSQVSNMIDFFRQGIVTLAEQNKTILHNQTLIMEALDINVGDNGSSDGSGDAPDIGGQRDAA